MAEEPATTDDLARQGRILVEAGDTEAAKAVFLEALNLDPTHFAALNDLGALLYDTGYGMAARTVFTEAVAHHPHQPLAHVNLANLMMYADEPEAARAHYETALRLDPTHAEAHQRLSELLRELGDETASEHHRRLGFGARPIQTLPFRGAGEPIGLLVLTSTPSGEIAWRKLVDETVFQVTAVAAEFFDPSAALPPHRLIFNAIGDVDVSSSDLQAAQRLVARSGSPVINSPDRVLITSRIDNATGLGRLPGVVTPRTATIPRSTLEAEGADALACRGFGFPVLLRSPGFHTGKHFLRVETAEELAAAVAQLPSETLMAIQPLDARGPDGFARKYRVMMIDGALHPLHLAISADWKVHYATGAVRDHPGFQAEEARFLEAMPEVLGERAMAALTAIQAALGLDYAGADFALGPAGEVLLFEANATMNIIPPDNSAQWDYRRPAIDRALAAARAMLVRRAQEAAHRPAGLPA